MPDYFDIYAHHADSYDRLVEREDYQQNILPAIDEIIPLEGLDVVELGTGTGRLTCLLAPKVRSIRAFDSSKAMLEVARRKLQQTGARNWEVHGSDHRHIKAESRCADLALSGWSLCYLALGKGDNWRKELSRGLKEMKRVLRNQGTAIILETLGTGHGTPAPPAELRDYFTFLEANGFQQKWIRTDYCFRDMPEARELTRFFFGEELLEKITESEKGIILPECTGLWWQKFN